MNRVFFLQEKPPYLQIESRQGQFCLHPDASVSLSRSLLVMDGRRLEQLDLPLEEGIHLLGYELKDHTGRLLESAETLLQILHDDSGYYDIPPTTPFNGSGDPFVIETPAPLQDGPTSSVPSTSAPAPQVQMDVPAIQPESEQPALISPPEPEEPPSPQAQKTVDARPPQAAALFLKDQPLPFDQCVPVRSLLDLRLEDPDRQAASLRLQAAGDRNVYASLEEAAAIRKNRQWQIEAVGEDGNHQIWKVQTFCVPALLELDWPGGSGRRWILLDGPGKTVSYRTLDPGAAGFYCGWQKAGRQPLLSGNPLRVYTPHPEGKWTLQTDETSYELTKTQDRLGLTYLQLPSGSSASGMIVLRNEISQLCLHPDSVPIFAWILAAAALLVVVIGVSVHVRIHFLQRGGGQSAVRPSARPRTRTSRFASGFMEKRH